MINLKELEEFVAEGGDYVGDLLGQDIIGTTTECSMSYLADDTLNELQKVVEL